MQRLGRLLDVLFWALSIYSAGWLIGIWGHDRLVLRFRSGSHESGTMFADYFTAVHINRLRVDGHDAARQSAPLTADRRFSPTLGIKVPSNVVQATQGEYIVRFPRSPRFNRLQSQQPQYAVYTLVNEDVITYFVPVSAQWLEIEYLICRPSGAVDGPFNMKVELKKARSWSRQPVEVFRLLVK